MEDADMEDVGKAPPPTEEQLFEAAEKGNAQPFLGLSSPQLAAVLASFRNADERTLLHVASANGHLQIVKIMCEGLDASQNIVNSADEEGWTPLHSAVSCGYTDVVEVLLQSGADVKLANKGGRTALHYAASKGRLKIAQLLLQHGAKINRKDEVGCTPLHRAASAGHANLCEFLIEEGADIEATDKMGQTPLMHAVICNDKEISLLLIRHGADVDAQDKEEYTVLGRASDELRPALIDAAKAMLEG